MIDGFADKAEPWALVGLFVFFVCLLAFIIALGDWNNHK
jgi:hypothetical protein